MMIKRNASKGKLFNFFVVLIVMGFFALPSYSFGEVVKQWEAYEISLTTSNSYTNEQKYQDVTLEATFTGPDGSSYTVPGFWDGVDTWKIRFTPTVEGSWNYTISSSDSQLDSSGNDGGFTAGSVSASDKSENQNYRGFLKVSTDQRHFTYDDGTPFFWMGETLWDGSSLQMAFDDTEFKFLIDDRKSKGFTAIQIAVAPPRAFREGPDSTDPLKPGWNEGGFVFNELFSEINPEYFKWLDKRIEYIVQAGMVPVIFGQWGWGVREMADAPSGTGIERLKKYWRYIIARYQAYNVVWVVSGEYRFGFVDRIRLLGEYIHETDGMEHLTTIHPGPPSTGKLSSSLDYHDAEWLDFNMNHTWEYDERSALLADYDKSPTKPIVNAEAGYLGLKDHGRARVRREAWTVFTSGGAGYTYGALGIYHWNDGCCDIRNGDTVPRWYDVYDLPSSYDMKHLVKFFSEFDWEKMSPRDDLVSKGYALAESGKQYAVYLKNGGTTTVSNLPVDYTAKWFNPREGTWTDATGGPSFTAPDANDWVLYIKDGASDTANDDTGTNENLELIGHWKLDSGTGIAATDSSSKSNEGILRNGPVWTTGKLGQALQFDGSNDYVEIPHSSAYLLDQGTVSFWFKADNVTQSQGLFSKDSSGFDTGGHLTIYIDTDSKLKARMQSTSNSITLTSSEIIQGIWYHVAFSFGKGGMELSLNGGTPLTNSYSGGFGSTSGGSGNFEPIVIGASSWLSGDKVATPIKAQFIGIMDDVRIYSKNLSDTEIADLASGKDISSSGDTTSNDDGASSGSSGSGSTLPDEAEPVLESVKVDGSDFVLTWSQPESNSGIPVGGYDIVIDGVDTDAQYRTTSLTTRISGLTMDVEHCFVIQGRWTQKDPTVLNLSNKLCGTITTDTGTNTGTEPVSHWSFNDGDGNIASDSSGTSDGTLLPNSPIWTDGKLGQALAFNGVDDYVEIPHSSAYLLDQGTVSFWFKADSVTKKQGLFSKDSSGFDTGGHLTIYIDTDSKVKVRMQSISGTHTLITSKISADTWYHVAFSFGGGGMELSLNGGPPVTNSYSGGLGSTSGGSGNFEPIVVGASSWYSGDKVATPVKVYFKGIIDELALFDVKLTETEIADLASGKDISSSGDSSPNDSSSSGSSSDDSFTEDTVEESVLPDEAAAVLESVKVDGSDFVLTWLQPESKSGTPTGGYDLVIDGVDTNSQYRTTSLTTRISGLTKDVEHCFVIQGRWTQKDPTVFNLSNKLCGTITTDTGTDTGTDPVSHWNFDDGDGHTATDSSGNNDGVLRPNSPVWTDGKLGQALEFNGVDDYVEIPHSSAYLLDQGTVSFWFKADNVTQSQGLFSKDSSGFDTGGHLTIYIDTDSKLKARLQSVSGSHTLISSNINPDTWYHVAFSFGEGGMELSLNGGTPVTNSYSGGFGSTSGGSGNFEPIVVGASGWHSGDKVATPIKAYFKGIIDELMLFDEKLSDTEIDELVAAGNNL